MFTVINSLMLEKREVVQIKFCPRFIALPSSPMASCLVAPLLAVQGKKVSGLTKPYTAHSQRSQTKLSSQTFIQHFTVKYNKLGALNDLLDFQ